ncbi:MAG: hypothetical protein J5938_05490 [Clostridia bacterium]|nr:hypothetical protein [Clostridia bacterium]
MKSEKHVLPAAALCLTALAVLLSFTSCFLFPESSSSAREDLSAYELNPDSWRLKSTVGAESLQALVETFLDYIRHDCDDSRLKGIQDPVGYLAMVLNGDLYEGRNLSLAQAREKAGRLFGTAEALKQNDPELYWWVYDSLNVTDSEEAVNQYMNRLKYAFQTGEIGPEDPKYDTYSRMLTDWDKGADYVMEHYSDMFSDFNMFVGMDSALRYVREYAAMKRHNDDLQVFRDLSAEFRPENIYTENGGFFSYSMGSVNRENGGHYSLYLNYYYENGRYYMIGYDVSVGADGG